MKQTIFLIIVIGVVIIGLGSIYTINESEQAIVTQFGKPVGGAVTESGIHFKMPIIQTVIKFDKRILEWDGSANEIPTLDNKYIFIDAFARWRISDALQFYKSAKNEMLAQSRLDDILDGAVRDEIANRTMVEIVRSSNRVMVVQDVESSSVNVNDKVVDRGNSKNVLDNPINSLTWLINTLAIQGKSLPGDSYISTGTCTPAIPLNINDNVRADFGKLGQVKFNFI